MFLRFYGLREQPFGVTPDPAYLYFSATHREALASLFYGIESGCGFLALIAQPGMGKTTLLFHLLEKLRSTAQTVFIFQTQCGSREFFRYLLSDLGADTGEQDLARMHESLNAVLLKNARMGRRVVLIIDEAQNLEDSVLETVRLLSDFETPRAKLLQIILCGQPQLATKLSHPSLAQLRQRISIIGRLHPFTRVETMVYIEYRLCKAGYAGPPLFGYDAVELIAAHSGGIPRNINNLCFNALTLGCAKRAKRIDAAIVSEVLADLDLEGLGVHPASAAPEALESLSSFDDLVPTDEATYHELHDAVRAAWGSETEAFIHKGDSESDPMLVPKASEPVGAADIESDVAPQLPGVASDAPREICAQMAPTAPVEAESASLPATLSVVEEETPIMSPSDSSVLHEDGTRTREGVSPTIQSGTRANTNGASAADFIRTNGTSISLFANVAARARALARFLPASSARKKIGEDDRHRAIGSGTAAVAIFTLVGGALMAVARHYESAKPAHTETSSVPHPIGVNVAPSATATSSAESSGAGALGVEQEGGEQTHPVTTPETSTVVTVESGQTLGGVSLRYLGHVTPTVIRKIRELNPEIKDPDLIFAGKQIRIPAPASDSHGNTSSPGGDPNPTESLQ